MSTASPFIPNPNTFAEVALDRADSVRADPARLAELWAAPSTRVLPLANGNPLVAMRGGGAALAWMAPGEAPGPEVGPIFLGLDAGAAYFAAGLGAEAFLPAGGASYASLRTVVPLLTSREASIAAQARSMVLWHQSHGFCAKCGQPTALECGGSRRTCSACSALHFPRVDPVVIMLAVHGERCLLGRQERHPPGMVSALAGYVEPGESLEAAVCRELLEEAGVQTGEVRYASSQPWPFPSTLMLGFYARATTTDIHLDGRELESAVWLDRAAASAAVRGRGDVVVPPPFAIAHHLIHAWADGYDPFGS